MKMTNLTNKKGRCISTAALENYVFGFNLVTCRVSVQNVGARIPTSSAR